MHNIYFERSCLDHKALGEDIAQCAKDALDQAPADIDRLGLDCADVIFDELVEDPMATVQKVYSHFGWEFSEEYSQILKTFLDDDKKKRSELRKKKGGKSVLHEHSLDFFGLREDDLKFEKYVKRYGMENCKK